MTYTPETLMALAEQRTYTGIGIPGEVGEDRSQIRRADLLALAAAWEAERIDTGLRIATIATLRKRLEEARRLFEYSGYGDDWDEMRERWLRGEPIDSALAAGDTISDGFGNTWSATCECGGKMQVVRPGKVQCSECG